MSRVRKPVISPILSQFGHTPDTSFSGAAAQTHRTALPQDGLQAAAAVKARFNARGICF